MIIIFMIITVDAMEVLIKYCINSFDRKLINFLLLLDGPIRFRFRTVWPIGNAQEVKRNYNSYELIGEHAQIEKRFINPRTSGCIRVSK
jgi:hypothetical protein